MKKFLISFVIIAVLGIGGLAIALPTMLHSLGLHPEYNGPTYDLPGKRALTITTSQGVLNAPGETSGKPTGVAILEGEMTFRDVFATHVEVDDEGRFVTGQSQNSGSETANAMMSLLTAD